MAIDLTAHVNALAELIYAGLEHRPRLLVALAGAPGAGKSTLAGELSRRLNAQRCAAQVLALDGWLLDNTVLDDAGVRGRKGAPETYDSAGFLHAIRRLREGEELVAPVYDRARDLATAGALIVAPATQVVIVEGHYLLFGESPWDALAPLWDIRARLDLPLPELRGRLIQRWLTQGLSRATATRRAEGNDIPNAQRIMAAALDADLILIPKAL